MRRTKTFASDIIFSNVVEVSDRAVKMAAEQCEAIEEAVDKLIKLGDESAAVGNRLDKKVHKALGLNLRTGKAVRLKRNCAYETASYAMQVAYCLQTAARHLVKETKRYQEAEPGAYTPAAAREHTRRRSKKRRCQGRHR